VLHKTANGGNGRSAATPPPLPSASQPPLLPN
jgi:hypothetical protein